MQLVHLNDMTPEHWFHAWNAMYDPYLADYMGVQEELVQNKPELPDFYRNITNAHAQGKFQGWAILKDDEFRGYTLLDKTVGEWESGTVLANQEDWSTGLGVFPTFHAWRWAFEEDGAEWVVAFTNGTDPKVMRMHEKIGYKRLLHFWVMSRDNWFDHVAAKYDRLRQRYLPDAGQGDD